MQIYAPSSAERAEFVLFMGCCGSDGATLGEALGETDGLALGEADGLALGEAVCGNDGACEGRGLAVGVDVMPVAAFSSDISFDMGSLERLGNTRYA